MVEKKNQIAGLTKSSHPTPDSALSFQLEAVFTLKVKHRNGKEEFYIIDNPEKPKQSLDSFMRWLKRNAWTHGILYPDGCEFTHGVVNNGGRLEFWNRDLEKSSEHVRHHGLSFHTSPETRRRQLHKLFKEREGKSFQKWLEEHSKADD